MYWYHTEKIDVDHHWDLRVKQVEYRENARAYFL